MAGEPGELERFAFDVASHQLGYVFGRLTAFATHADAPCTRNSWSGERRGGYTHCDRHQEHPFYRQARNTLGYHCAWAFHFRG